MSGLKITIPQAFTDTTLPVLRDDPLLTVGSLVLIDPAHPAYPLGATLPASGATIPNLAWKEAAAVLGTASPTKDSLPSLFTYGGGIGPASGSPTKGIIERSAKGGFHGILSQATALASGDHASINLDVSVRNYLAANPAHAYYMSLWGRNTRLDPTPTDLNTSAEFAGIGVTSSTGNCIILMRNNNAFIPFANASGMTQIPGALGNFLASIGYTGVLNGVAQAAGRATWGAYAGGYNAAVLASRNSHWASWVFYRLYVEDLTVSGRSYATVKALDDTAYASAFATGGRYAGDTFTATTALA